MAAVASPTPLSFSTSASEFHHPNVRSLSRTTYSRSYGHRSPQTVSKRRYTPKQSSGDSSDDDDLAPIKLSAEAQAILGEDNSQAGSDKENVNIYARQLAAEKASYGSESWNAVERLRGTGASHHGNGSPAPRIVPVTVAPRPALTNARDGSFMYKTVDRTGTTAPQQPAESYTPPKAKRIIRVSTGRRSSRSPTTGPSSEHSSEKSKVPAETHEERPHSPEQKSHLDEDLQVGPSTVARQRKPDDNGAHSTMRTRRIGDASRLGKPLRRGMIRRPSEDDHHSMHREGSRSPEVEMGRRAAEQDLPDYPDLDLPSNGSPRLPMRAASTERKNVMAVSLGNAPAPEPQSPIHIPLSVSVNKSRPTPASNGSHPSTRSSSSQRRPVFKVPPLPNSGPEHDQENEPPPTFKKTKPSGPMLQIHEDTAKTEEKVQPPAPAADSPNRQPLVARSNNTPHRPAPAPPPKMSLLEAATSNSNSRKKGTSHVVINGKAYRKLDCVGRGGSSRVYRVMADNFKIFAMKRVNLEDADMAAIAGYKGEIDLLRKLANEDRVIRLFDYEINEEKGVLNVLMEHGERDFYKILEAQLKAENAKLDVTFNRHYWKEMLVCVNAVHNQGIVHSDLKPANFLLVKGQLKLIDFGIANAIQDNTVNVHRENQIGTPNYMSPESLICNNVSMGPQGEIKDIKLGKPSDVWSLGCILYQMTYGQPPFAHIQPPMQRIMAIPNPKVEIQFPTLGIGGSVVPFGLIKTLRRCLTREASLRPTIDELLNDTDPFLCPVAISPDMLGRVIGNVVSYCRRREENLKAKGELGVGESCLPKDEEMRGWPLAFYEKLRQAQEEGTAW